MLYFAPTLPLDVLRVVFELAAVEDKRTALKLVVVSSLTQRWIERILYSVVNLYRETTSRAFLRTIETSRLKSKSFFATHVKSLCISYHIHNHRTTRIIHACKGVTNLTFWGVPSSIPTPTYWPHQEITEALSPLRPTKLSILLTGSLRTPHPPFHLSFFQKITHLSVINRWEDWSAWAGFDTLPSLTHLSFDLSGSLTSKALHDPVVTNILVRCLRLILTRCRRLQVCVLVLIFDPDPALTASMISRAMGDWDPRLVFVHDTEPFSEREAHSVKEADVWRVAEEVVRKQNDPNGRLFFC